MRVGIVGAGMAGLACAEGLARSGHDVVLLDKGSGPGGRMSTRRLLTVIGEAHFDHGAQYFTVRDQGFRSRVDAWIAEGVVAPWPAAGSDVYVGVPAMNSPVRRMAQGLTVHWSTLVTKVESDGHGWRLFVESGEVFDVDMAVIAAPAEQAAVLLATAAPDLASRAGAATSQPCWTVMLAFSAPVATVRDCWRGEDVIGWAARNSAKPGRTEPESWVVQATPDWSRRHLEADPDWVAVTLTAALSNTLGVALPPRIGIASHRWRFARSAAEGSGAILDRNRRLGVCGDWLIGPRVEAAWVSGASLAQRVGAGDSVDPTRAG
jgi:renalase